MTGDSFGYGVDGIGHFVEDKFEASKRMFSMEKLIALAKYYFLEKMAALRIPADRLAYAILLEAKFFATLRMRCREFAEAEREPRIITKTRGVTSVVSRQASSRAGTGTFGTGSQLAQRERCDLTSIACMSSCEATKQATSARATLSRHATTGDGATGSQFSYISGAPPGLLDCETGGLPASDGIENRVAVERPSSHALMESQPALEPIPIDEFPVDRNERIDAFNSRLVSETDLGGKLKNIDERRREIGQD